MCEHCTNRVRISSVVSVKQIFIGQKNSNSTVFSDYLYTYKADFISIRIFTPLQHTIIDKYPIVHYFEYTNTKKSNEL